MVSIILTRRKKEMFTMMNIGIYDAAISPRRSVLKI